MAIKGPQAIIGSALARLRVFSHARQNGQSVQEGKDLNPRPLSEIPGTKANFEATKPQTPENVQGSGEKKG